MKKFAWLAVPFCLLGAGCAHQEAFDDAQREIASQDAVIKQLKTRNEELIAERDGLTTDLKRAKAEVGALEKGRETLDKDLVAMKARLEGFQKKFTDLDGILGVRTKARADGVALEVADTVLFALGRASLTDKGREVLDRVAERISSHEGDIRVEGHTDDQPVVVRAKQYPMGNLQLSGRRALVVADHLIKKGGIPASKISYAGFGEFHPVVANASTDDRARNRRVEIVLLRGPVDKK